MLFTQWTPGLASTVAIFSSLEGALMYIALEAVKPSICVKLVRLRQEPGKVLLANVFIVRKIFMCQSTGLSRQNTVRASAQR